MCEFGEDYAINLVGHIDTGETINSIKGYRQDDKGVIVAGGNAIWLEFGTGVKHNGGVGSYPHPLASKLGMSAIGTYGAGHGADKNGWYYPSEDGEWKHTYGIEANMFMYRTAQELINQFPDMAMEVFR